ncbi:MAG TPA: hypothetical protein VKT29_08030 [Terriglobales bacterium]|nr:hypothetical protein [Terriglobales bacterium]
MLVLIGLGATVASVLATVPWLITLSKDKDWVFGISGVLIFSNLIYVYRIAPRLKTPDASCKIQNAELCKTASRLSRVLLWFSAAIYAIGFFSAYVLGPILIWLDSR